jgi:predicted exporter
MLLLPLAITLGFLTAVLDHLGGNLPWYIIGAPVIIAFLLALLMIILGIRYAQIFQEFARANGKKCFACWYDMIESQTHCPECGARWDQNDLAGRWKQACED